MDPRAGLTGDILAKIVRSIPISGARVPKRFGLHGDPGGWVVVAGGGLGKFFCCHFVVHSEAQVAPIRKAFLSLNHPAFPLARLPFPCLYLPMKKAFFPVAICSSLFLLSQAANAKLPQLNEKPFLGYFIGIKDRKLQFGVTSDGKAMLFPLKRDGSPVSLFNPIPVSYEILETMPDGKVVSKTIKVESLATTHPATENPETPVTFTGMVTGNAAFEVTVAEERGGFSLSGKITDKGTLTNPLQFVISINFNPYKEGGGKDDEALEKFEKKIKREELSLTTTDSKREKIEFLSSVNPAKLYSQGLTKAELKTEGFGGIGFGLEAVGKSKIMFEEKVEKPFWNGFTARWSVNEDGDPAQAKLIVTAN